MNEPKQTVKGYWLDNRNRRQFRGVSPYRGKNVINAARWRYVRAHQRNDMLDGRLKLLDARIAAIDNEIAAMVEKLVARELALAGIRTHNAHTKP